MLARERTLDRNNPSGGVELGETVWDPFAEGQDGFRPRAARLGQAISKDATHVLTILVQRMGKPGGVPIPPLPGAK
jgi:hypothetical protein